MDGFLLYMQLNGLDLPVTLKKVKLKLVLHNQIFDWWHEVHNAAYNGKEPPT